MKSAMAKIACVLSLGLMSCFNSGRQDNPSLSSTERPSADEWNARRDIGLKLFAVNCEKCHTAPHKPIQDGSMWGGLFDRVPSGEKYVIEFICSSSKLRNDSDLYAIRIKEIWGNRDYEHEFSGSLTKDELKNLMVYLKEDIN